MNRPPQRTPVLYQAGASSRGKQFAASHAECVFVASPSKSALKKTVADIRRRAQEAGRDPHSILIFNMQTAIVGETDKAAQAKWQEYKSYTSYEGALALISGWTGSILASTSRTKCLPIQKPTRFNRSSTRFRPPILIASGR
ncbi:Putative monooxygenase moxC [Kluyvera cryocrescens]|uniref:Monooxygenase moxC n=1 Tax=Kluyvera cryocrescens TaxID=580 RepID=A0A485A5Z1_KLUCR|nr:Putative monooxygenase moxC [Kluyvera cryocrescens]